MSAAVSVSEGILRTPRGSVPFSATETKVCGRSMTDLQALAMAFWSRRARSNAAQPTLADSGPRV